MDLTLKGEPNLKKIKIKTPSREIRGRLFKWHSSLLQNGSPWRPFKLRAPLLNKCLVPSLTTWQRTWGQLGEEGGGGEEFYSQAPAHLRPIWNEDFRKSESIIWVNALSRLLWITLPLRQYSSRTPYSAAIKKCVLGEYLMTLETSQKQVANQRVQHDSNFRFKKEILYMGEKKD